MTIEELYETSEKFASIFGESLWDFLDKWTGFDLLCFEETFCPPDLESISHYISATYGKEAAALVEKCNQLGNFQKICSTIGSKVILGQKKYLGTTYSVILVPVAVKTNSHKPIQLKEIEGYVLGCLAVNKNGDLWNLQHLPSGLVAGKYSCSAKQAIGKMKLALSFNTIEQVSPNKDCVEKLKELQFSSKNL